MSSLKLGNGTLALLRVKIDINTAQLLILRADTEKLAEGIQKIKEKRLKYVEERKENQRKKKSI